MVSMTGTLLPLAVSSLQMMAKAKGSPSAACT